MNNKLRNDEKNTKFRVISLTGKKTTRRKQLFFFNFRSDPDPIFNQNEVAKHQNEVDPKHWKKG